jgi:hypothetical protein
MWVRLIVDCHRVEEKTRRQRLILNDAQPPWKEFACWALVQRPIAQRLLGPMVGEVLLSAQRGEDLRAGSVEFD